MIGWDGVMNWETFKNRVPNGTKIRFTHPGRDTSIPYDGVLLENYPYADEEFWAAYNSHRPEGTVAKLRYRNTEHILKNQPTTNDHDSDLFVDMVEYLIDNEWLTFAEVMTG